uniref:solute carrier family 2, facilitated glucose transporter member 1-like n=1 Tax=Styela clava TaxID=7725 RepID=UPI0019396662|nr:solute carrier family 2, facilitated glucose transporter member 1-like [Styela clava]
MEVFINESYQIRYNEVPSAATATLIINLAHSSLVWGSVLGCISVKLVINTFSRKGSILFVHIFLVLSSVLMGPVAQYWHVYETLIIGRFLNGVFKAIALAVVMIYVAEISSRKRVGFYQGPFSTFQYISSAFGMGLSHSKVLGTQELWMWTMCISIVASIIYFLCYPWIPETPVYLLETGKWEDALNNLKKLRSNSNVESELTTLQKESREISQRNYLTLSSIFKKKYLRRQLFVNTIIRTTSQLLGLQAIEMFSDSLLLDAGVDEKYVTILSVGVFLQIILAFLITAPLQRRFGLKKVYVIGLIIISLSYFIFTIAGGLYVKFQYMSSVAIVGFFTLVFGFQIGPLFVTFGLPSELTTASSRPTVVFYSQCTLWISAGIITFVFPYSHQAWGVYAYTPFVIMSIVLIPFSVFLVPETHNRSAAQIQKSFGRETMNDEFHQIDSNRSIASIT